MLTAECKGEKTHSRPFEWVRMDGMDGNGREWMGMAGMDANVRIVFSPLGVSRAAEPPSPPNNAENFESPPP